MDVHKRMTACCNCSLDLYAAPHNVTIERGHQLNSAVISWKPLFNDKIKVFNVSCCENNQSCIAPKHEVTSNNISIDGLLPLTEYHFRVSAIRGNRQGDWSSCVSYTTPSETERLISSVIASVIDQLLFRLHPTT